MFHAQLDSSTHLELGAVDISALQVLLAPVSLLYSVGIKPFVFAAVVAAAAAADTATATATATSEVGPLGRGNSLGHGDDYFN